LPVHDDGLQQPGPVQLVSQQQRAVLAIAVWAGEVSFWPTKNAYLRVGASESNPDQYPHAGFPWNKGWSTSSATGVFVPAEIGYVTEPTEERYARKYDVGFYYDSTDFPDFRYNSNGGRLAFNGGTPASAGSQTVAYAQVRQMIWRPDPSKPQGLTAFAGVLVNTSGRALVQNYFELGLAVC
jgi:porin